MESRIIYECDKTHLMKIHWLKPKIDSESEWLYLNPEKFNESDSEEIFNQNFTGEKVFLTINRRESKQVSKSDIYKEIRLLYGKTKFRVWDENFENVAEFEMEVYRKGKKPAANSRLAQ